MGLAYFFYLPAHLGGDLWSVRSPSTENHLRVGRQMANGINEMGDALLAGDPPHKKDVRFDRIYSVFDERGNVRGFLILFEINSVVNYVNALWRNIRISTQDVFLCSVRHSDHRICVKNCGPLHPRTHGVPAAELFGFPGA